MLALIALVNWLYSVLHTCIDLLLHIAIVLPCRIVYQGLFCRSGGPTAKSSSFLAKSRNGNFTRSASLKPPRKDISIKRIINKRTLKAKPTLIQKIRSFVLSFISGAFRFVKSFASVLYFCADFAVDCYFVLEHRLRHSLRTVVLRDVIAFVVASSSSLLPSFVTDGLRRLRSLLGAMSHKMIDCNHLRPRFLTLQRDVTQFPAPFYIFPTSPIAAGTNEYVYLVVPDALNDRYDWYSCTPVHVRMTNSKPVRVRVHVLGSSS